MAYKSKYKGAEIDARLEKMVKVTYAELVALRDEGKLIAGQMYRMTDYETYCGWADTECAGHPFDLVLTALDEKTLDEKCSAIWSERDTDGYFANSNLPAWDVRYCLDNDTVRFDWAVKGGKYIVLDFTEINFGKLVCFMDGTLEYEGITYVKWPTELDGMTVYFLTTTDSPSVGEDTLICFDEGGELYVEEGIPIDDVGSSDTDGKGVIYGLTDELNNRVPYDFKNIKFIREVDEQKIFFYTFSLGGVNGVYEGTVIDKTIVDNYFADGCKNNVFLGSGGYSCNTFGRGCHSNTFGYGCTSNTLGNGCYSNSFDQFCQFNTLEDGCYSNTFLYGCENNTLGEHCFSNTFGSYCSHNTFGYRCSKNTFGDSCSQNTFGHGCGSNRFVNKEESFLKNNVLFYNVTRLSGRDIPADSNRYCETYVTLNKRGEMVEYTVDDIISK